MNLPPYNHPEVQAVRRKWIINHNRGPNAAERTRCEAIQLINQYDWQCSPEFILGLSSETSTIPSQRISNVQPVMEPQNIPKTPDSQCNKCGKPFNFDDKARKALRISDNFCSPGCRSKFYRNHKTKT